MSSEPKALWRSKDDKWLAGVCGGLGHRFDISSNLIRLIFVLLTLFGLAGIIIYVLLWVLIPPESDLDTMVAADDAVEAYEASLAEEQSASQPAEDMQESNLDAPSDQEGED
jgi:phage shock protein C